MYWICNKGTVGKQTVPFLYLKNHIRPYPCKSFKFFLLQCFENWGLTF